MAHVHIRRSWELPERDATPESVYRNRREVLRSLGLGIAGLAFAPAWKCRSALAVDPEEGMLDPAVGARFKEKFPAKRNPKYTLVDLLITPEEKAGNFINFYEFNDQKKDIWRLAKGFRVDPWKVEVGGLVKKPRTMDLEEIFTRFALEERQYRFRCVEAWAMQVPWIGYPLRDLIKSLDPLPSAKYVRFVTFLDPEHAPGQRRLTHYPWPYYEALRLDEALHELAFVAVGIYGHALPMQHGAPWRIVVPWKYGFKSAKSLVKIEFTEKRPATFWNDAAPTEYGFYSNINPDKPHPRWSQAMESDIGTGRKRKTILYGGYREQVASLYRGDES